MPYFPTLTVAGQKITFGHLEPVSLVVPTTTKPAGVRIDVVFSNHCFSETFDATVHTGEIVDVWDGKRRRVFDQARYDLSQTLPTIVQNLSNSHVFMTPEANFVRITTPAGMQLEYRMFFQLKKGGGNHDLKLRVESAYTPEPGQAVPERDMTKVRFVVLVDKTLRGEKMRTHYKR